MANLADVTSFFATMLMSADDHGMTGNRRQTNQCGGGG
jgi:hypothetical protein